MEFVDLIDSREMVLRRSEGAAIREERFSALVRRQSRFIFSIGYSILRRHEDAEDVVQETFLRVYRSGAWEKMENEKAFLARTAWRIAVDRLPKKRTEPLSDGLMSSEASPERAAIDAGRSEVVHRLIDSLPEELRQPLALSTVEEMTSAEIAVIMSIPEGTVRGRLMRAREILKQKLAGWKGADYER